MKLLDALVVGVIALLFVAGVTETISRNINMEAASQTHQPPSSTYALILTYGEEGHTEEWVVDFDLSLGACVDLLKDYPHSDDGHLRFYCAIEPAPINEAGEI